MDSLEALGDPCSGRTRAVFQIKAQRLLPETLRKQMGEEKPDGTSNLKMKAVTEFRISR